VWIVSDSPSVGLIEPDVRDVELALEAIAAMDPRARPHPSMRCSCMLRREGRTLYVKLRAEAELPDGSIYVTWVVDIRDGAVMSTKYFLTRVGTGDTLPPIPLHELEHL
jgi:hypothetical protein